jgi:hypothetical protein
MKFDLLVLTYTVLLQIRNKLSVRNYFIHHEIIGVEFQT